MLQRLLPLALQAGTPLASLLAVIARVVVLASPRRSPPREKLRAHKERVLVTRIRAFFELD